jgi:hypothetical protein
MLTINPAAMMLNVYLMISFPYVSSVPGKSSVPVSFFFFWVAVKTMQAHHL